MAVQSGARQVRAVKRRRDDTAARPRRRPSRWVAWLMLLAGTAGMAACERRDDPGEEQSEPLLTLSVETPEALDWGGSGVVRVTVTNSGDTTAEGGIVELHVPDWLEFGMVEPAGTEVTVLSGDDETRLSYNFTEPFPPGDRRTVVQHLRVAYRPSPVAPDTDTLPTVQLPPANQLLRARLLTPDGHPAGAEVQATLHFVGRSGPLPPPPVGDTVPPADTTAASPGGRTMPDTLMGSG
jgi:hypothetical protein